MSERNPLEEARERAGLTRPALGERIGVDAMTIYRWERLGNVPREKYRPKIEEVLGVRIGVAMTPREVAE
jgi:ribosome-binding protein aMBF1 (putative translation factor)